jgi:hypothetical protein
MQELQVLGGLISRRHDDRYRDYRRNYVEALLKMRRSLVPKEAAQATETTVSSTQGITTPSSSNPR